MSTKNSLALAQMLVAASVSDGDYIRGNQPEHYAAKGKKKKRRRKKSRRGPSGEKKGRKTQ